MIRDTDFWLTATTFAMAVWVWKSNSAATLPKRAYYIVPEPGTYGGPVEWKNSRLVFL